MGVNLIVIVSLALPKVLSLDNENKNEFFFCIVLA